MANSPININTTPTYGAPFLQPMGNLLANYAVGQLQQPQDISGLMPQVAQISPLTQQAQQLGATQAGLGALQFNDQGQIIGTGQGTGIAGYQPYLNQANAYSGPQGYEQFMSPYQQQVIDPTLQQYDIQSQRGALANPASAIKAGAFGGARQGVEQGVYQSQSDMNRALLQAQLQQQGFTQAQTAANTAFNQQQGLASLQPTLASNNINQLGTLGTGAQQYGQNILNATQQGNQLQQQYPWQQLQNATGIFSSLLGTPGTPGAPITESPALTASKAMGSILGPLGSTGIGNALTSAGNLGGQVWNAAKGIWESVGGSGSVNMGGGAGNTGEVGNQTGSTSGTYDPSTGIFSDTSGASDIYSTGDYIF